MYPVAIPVTSPLFLERSSRLAYASCKTSRIGMNPALFRPSDTERISLSAVSKTFAIVSSSWYAFFTIFVDVLINLRRVDFSKTI